MYESFGDKNTLEESQGYISGQMWCPKCLKYHYSLTVCPNYYASYAPAKVVRYKEFYY
jgi:hypothetical protein